MNNTKPILGLFVGALITGVCFTLVFYYIEKTFPSSGSFISFDGSWLLAILIGVICGLPVGSSIGAIITSLQLTFVKSTLLGGILGLILSFGLFILSGGSLDNKLKIILGSLIVIGTINGAVVSLVTNGQQPSNN
jgi:hypothetical protein